CLLPDVDRRARTLRSRAFVKPVAYAFTRAFCPRDAAMAADAFRTRAGGAARSAPALDVHRKRVLPTFAVFTWASLAARASGGHVGSGRATQPALGAQCGCHGLAPTSQSGTAGSRAAATGRTAVGLHFPG